LLRWLSQPNAGTATVARQELDTGVLKGATNGFKSTGIKALASFKAGDSGW
jgi:hypothetical protein